MTGRGDVFCSGLDLHSIDFQSQGARHRAHFRMRSYMDPLILRLSNFRFPIVAAINGVAAGAGMSLALAGDILICSEDAYLTPSFARLGLVPDAGITFSLARRIGSGRALSALMLAEKIDANTALTWGLAYAVVPAADVVTRAQSVAKSLAAGPSGVLGQIRLLHASAFDNSLRQQLTAERGAQEMMLETQECVEGVRAFFQKRAPDFSER
jgi:2-(1,2-epoxy-1,2-dihydrophenyl)acetyl-CoA isomerase